MLKRYQIGIIFGAFDMFHLGHLKVLRDARALCERLVVCVSTDEYIDKKNGYLPIIPFYQRFKIVMANKYVDDIDRRDSEYTRESAINEYQPNVIFIGDTRKVKFKDDKFNGIPIVYLPYDRGVSIKLLRKRLKGER